MGRINTEAVVTPETECDHIVGLWTYWDDAALVTVKNRHAFSALNVEFNFCPECGCKLRYNEPIIRHHSAPAVPEEPR